MKGSPCNGWDHWYFEDTGGELHPLDELRQRVRRIDAGAEQVKRGG
jgi:hypothetical protein